MVTLRPATPADTAEMAAIRTSTLRERAAESYSAAELDAIAPKHLGSDRESGVVQSDDFEVVVAEDDELLGFGVVHPGDCQLHGLYVRPDATDEGVGTALLAELEAFSREEGCESMFALSTLNAVPFYLKHGYERVGEETISTDPEIPVVRVERTFDGA